MFTRISPVKSGRLPFPPSCVHTMSRGVNRLPGLLARAFSATSTAIRPERAGLSGDGGVLRTRRIPDGPGLAYFVESCSPPRSADESPSKRGEWCLWSCRLSSHIEQVMLPSNMGRHRLERESTSPHIPQTVVFEPGTKYDSDIVL